MSAPGPFQDQPAIRVEGLSLARGGRTLFEGIDLAAGSGDFVEIRGANGSGKTSLLRAIAGFLKPRAGRIRFERTDDPSLSVHYFGHLNALKGAVSVDAHVRYWSGLFGAQRADADVLTRVGLDGYGAAPARALSQGQARRLALARLLLAPRPIWLLDEPAAALDANGRAMLNRLIDAHRAAGGLVVAAVHGELGPTPSASLVLGAA